MLRSCLGRNNDVLAEYLVQPENVNITVKEAKDSFTVLLGAWLVCKRLPQVLHRIVGVTRPKEVRWEVLASSVGGHERPMPINSILTLLTSVFSFI